MSVALLQRVKGHIIDSGGLLAGYSVRYFRWSDADLNGAGSVALFRMSGTYGQIDHVVQFHDVSLYLLADPAGVQQADIDMLAVLRYLRANYDDTGVFSFYPIAGYTGPNYLQNDRAMFELVVRCGVTDH